MSRIAMSMILFLASVGLAVAGVAPPVPRIPSAALKPPAPEEPAEAEDAAKIADRILQNTKDAADRLKESDPGIDTRKKQDQTLRDIDALLKQAENPPPMGGGGMSGMNDQKNQDMSGESSPKGGSQKGMGKPQGGPGQKQAGASDSKGRSWRDRRNQQRAGTGKEPGPGEPKSLPDPTGSGQRTDAKAGTAAGGNDRGGRLGQPPPTLPVDDAIAKQVWGHLPEKLRQQMSQYYKEQFMPKYDDLLRQYYSSLAEREKAPKK